MDMVSEKGYAKLLNPEEELQRAQSDYLNLSKHYGDLTTVEYCEAEEIAWNRLEDALRALGKIKPFTLDKSEPSV